MLKFKFIPIVQCLYVLTVFSLLSERCFAQSAVSNIDVWNFWRAYDLLSQTKDSIERANIINNQYLSKASKPLQAMLKMDSMTASTYLQRIKKNPARYNRVRMKTLDLAQDNPEISRLFVK